MTEHSSHEAWSNQLTPSEWTNTRFTHSDDEPWRGSRIQEVFEVAQQICMVVHRQPFPADVVIAMHDHEGHLDVLFADEAWRDELRPMFELAWVWAYESADEVDVYTVDGEDKWPWSDACKAAEA